MVQVTTRSDDGMRVVGTIRSIELHATATKFQNVSSRQVAKIQLDIERAQDDEGEDLDVLNLADLSFQGPAELVPRFHEGDRVQIVTSAESQLHITSIRPAPLS
jgi:putative aminopeptidase FrvX